MKEKKSSDIRKAEYPLDNLFLNRWSQRAMSGEEISDKELFTLFEAAKWAPSSFNEQPWRFIYAKKNTKFWDKMFGILNESNQVWCKNAAVIVCLISNKNFSHNGNPNRNHMSDAGSAWENLALQAAISNLAVRGMAGYDVEKARKELKVPNSYEVVHMIAIGKHGKKEDLPEKLRNMESPNSRKSVKEIIFEGEFKD